MSYKNCLASKSAAVSSLVAAATLCFSAMASAAPLASFDGGLPGGWTGMGGYGTSGEDGVVTASPNGGAYGWVSTNGGVNGTTLPGGGSVGGSFVQTSVFSVNAGDRLSFDFNYITSDGGRYADYAWVRLLSADLTQSTMLLTVRTTPDGNDLTGAQSQGSSNVSIIGGAPVWSPLGADSGECFDIGCGYTGWLNMSFDIADAGDYILEFGVSGWRDMDYHSGLAFDGITVGGDSQVPEPASLALLGLGLAGLAWGRRRQIV
ncbi:NF038132 family protein [Thauera sp. Sel9]|uniref:NF038132 family protein n=1 Tax=Thauera sp. Sel9 TaxID=2974299 RepID=UPI0021E19302|nr:NF038132 family protein [Thauera sp. Sel9]MCV2217394.1 NF038132 family protein [Thauera sp. Sel9]